MEEQNLDSTSDDGQEQLPKPPETPEEAVPKPLEEAGKEDAEKAPEPPKEPEKIYSEEELRTRQSSWDKHMEELRKQHKEEVKQIRVELATQQRKDVVAQAEAAGEDAEKAGRVFDREQAVVAREQEQEALATVLNDAKRDRDADGYISKFGLETSAKEELLKAENPAEMRSRALEMALEATKATKTPPVKTPSAVTTGKAFDASKATPHDRLGEYFEEKLAGGE